MARDLLEEDTSLEGRVWSSFTSFNSFSRFVGCFSCLFVYIEFFETVYCVLVS